MVQIESILARLFLIFASLAFSLFLVEKVAEFYLWNIASRDEFNEFASINQLKERYGDDLFINSNEASRDVLYAPHHYLGYVLTPNLERGGNRHNSLGFRGDEISLNKPENTYRIVTIGGSTTYSTGVQNYLESYPYQLGEYLKQLGRSHIEVVNAGVGGYASYHSLIGLQFKVLPLQPDLLIVYQGYNDIHTRFVYPHSKYRGDNSGHISPFVPAIAMPEIWEYSTAMRVIGVRAGMTKPHSAIEWYSHNIAQSSYRSSFKFQWLNGTYPRNIFVEIPAMEMLVNNPPIHFERNLISMISMADGHDAAMMLITFVTSTNFDHPNVASDEYIFALRQHNDVTRKVAASTDTPLYDMADSFPDDDSLFTDGRHMTKEGNRIRAQLIGDYVYHEFLS